MQTTQTFTPKVGDLVLSTTCGRVILITDHFEDVKNGRPGFDGMLVKSADPNDIPAGRGVWGYDSQIVKIYDL